MFAPAAIAAAAVAAIVGPGCGSATPPESAERSFAQSIVGGLADPVIATAGQVVNRYAPLAADAAAGATTVTVTVAGATALAAAPGDLLMVIQMQGAKVDGTNTAAFGSITALGSAGDFEMVTVASVSGATITLAAGCGLRNAYSAAAHTQVVWVPQYKALTVTATGSISAPPWNGVTGGVVAVNAETALIAGAIDVSGDGFRGGALSNFADAPVTAGFEYRSLVADTGAEKGESIAGYEADYDAPAIGGRYSVGAIANGGGGGAAHNGGGGGGANGDDGNAWTGAGVMPGNVVGAAAWALDAADVTAGGLTRSSGGGRGGYSYSSAPRDPTAVAPGNALWAGDHRQYRGGLGGRPLASDPVGRVFFGGGGGAGNENNDSGGAGGRGGGIVYLVAGALSGTGAVRADGAAGANTAAGPDLGNDAPGGGGAGGSIVVVAPSTASLTFSAEGGAGGNQIIAGFGSEAEGPGGGGGGGFIAVPGAGPTIPAGGAGGTTNSPTMVTFPRNGATDGAAGKLVTLGANAQPPMCIAADLGVTMVQSGGAPTAGANVTYTITVTNHGPNPASGATVQDTFGPSFSGDTWTCTGTACPAASGSGNLAATLGALDPSAFATFTVVASVAPAATGTLTNTATVAAPAGITDGVLADNSATVTGPLNAASANLDLTLTHAPTPIVVGSAFTSTLTVSNMGPSVATAVSATFTAPTGSTLGTVTAPGWTCAAPVGLAVTCSQPTLAAGASASISVAETAPAVPAALSASATISTTVSDPGVKTVSDPIAVVCNADSQCGASQWCSAAGVCVPKVANGLPISPDAPVSGTCTANNAQRACVSLVCDLRGSVCGIQLGDGLCASTAQCIAGLCDPATHTCLLPSDAGPADASTDAGPGDAGPGDAGTDAGPGDAGTDAGPADGGGDAGSTDAGNDAGDAGARDGASDSAGDGSAPDASTAPDASDAAGDGAAPDASVDGGGADAGVDGADASNATGGDAEPDAGTDDGAVDANSLGDAGDAGAEGDAANGADATAAADGAGASGGSSSAPIDTGTIEGGGLSCAVGEGPGRSSAPGGWLSLATAVVGIWIQRRRRPRRA